MEYREIQWKIENKSPVEKLIFEKSRIIMHMKSKPTYVKLKERMITEGWITLLLLIWISIKRYYSPQECKPNREFRLITNAVWCIKVILFFDYKTFKLYHWKIRNPLIMKKKSRMEVEVFEAHANKKLQIIFIMASFNITQETTQKF